MTEIRLKIAGMTCGGCAMAVKQALTGVTGVTTADVNLRPGLATVTTGTSVFDS